MAKAYTRVAVESGSADWLKWRQLNGIGASEVASVMGLNKYKSSAALFYEKLGLRDPDPDNINMYVGRHDEEHIVKEYWQFYEGDNHSIVVNGNAGRHVRKARRFNGIMQSKKYPWLFATLDFQFRHSTGSMAVLEAKEISPEYAFVWETGIPIMYVFQIQTQLLCSGYEYGELFMREGLRDFKVYPFSPAPDVFETIAKHTKTFWDDVLKARQILMAGGGEDDIMHLVPPPDGSEAYQQFIKEKYRDGENSDQLIVPRDNHVHLVLNYMRLEEEVKAVEQEFTRVKQELQLEIDTFDGIDFGPEFGKITWKYDKNGNRRFRAAIKKDKLQDLQAGQAAGVEDSGADHQDAALEGI